MSTRRSKHHAKAVDRPSTTLKSEAEQRTTTKVAPSSDARFPESTATCSLSIRTALVMVRDNAVATQAAVRVVYRVLECQNADIDRSASIVLRRSVLALIEDIICDVDKIYAAAGS